MHLISFVFWNTEAPIITTKEGKTQHGSTTFKAHNPKVLQYVKENFPAVLNQLPFTCIGGAIVSHNAAAVVQDLVYHEGAAGARDRCIELKAQQYYRMLHMYYTFHDQKIQSFSDSTAKAAGQQTMLNFVKVRFVLAV